MQIFISLLTGMIFGAGLAVSQMMNPAKVLNFLDITGDWDPTLAVVMAAALLVSLPAYRWAHGRKKPLFSDVFRIPARKEIDKPLVLGAAVFGIGWGLAGFCPGPAIAALSTGMTEVLVFFASMVAGMLIFKLTKPT